MTTLQRLFQIEADSDRFKKSDYGSILAHSDSLEFDGMKHATMIGHALSRDL